MITSIASSSYLAGMGNVQSPGACQNEGKEVAGAGEKVTISKVGRAASDLRRRMTVSGTVSVESFREQLELDTGYVEGKLQELYRKFDIGPETEMKLSVGYDGTILVSGEGDKAQKLADAINTDDEMANTIRRMSANASLLEAARKHQEFSEAYEKNPQQAVERFGYLLEDGHDYYVNFTYSNGKLDTEVTYV
ncbi:MAG: hypothetical protein KQH63_02210 [Desulfobulbaceae bacterium]|nr:hypothetical protein [Desulfobulbaceae bacterium]